MAGASEAVDPGKGAFTISIDLELAWGVWDKLSPAYIERCAAVERPVVRRLLDLFSRHELPATWATVGSLLEPWTGSGPGPAEIWSAPDLVEQIRKDPRQEIGSHSFAHVYFAEIDRAAATEDLARAREVHARHGLPFETFVFPRNQVAHVDLLAAAGLRVFRSRDAGWHIAVARLDRRLGKLANFADKVIPVTSTVAPRPHPGVVELPSSMLLFGRNGPRRFLPAELVYRKARRALEDAARSRRLFHLWFHPSNFYWETETQLDLLARILKDAAALRERGEIQIVPMGAYARA